jgi:hypothetical protein
VKVRREGGPVETNEAAMLAMPPLIGEAVVEIVDGAERRHVGLNRGAADCDAAARAAAFAGRV